MKHFETYKRIKEEFCHLFNFKSHGNTLEIITPLVTITNKFVSVFITPRGDKLIVTDGGWIRQEVYDHSIISDDRDIVSTLIQQYKKYYHINQTSGDGNIFYFRSIDKIELLSSAVFDIANFIVGVVNSYSLEYKEKKEKEDRDNFKSETNDFLKQHYHKNFKSGSELVKGVRYNGILTINSRIHLFEYITGSSTRYYENDMRKAIVNFKLIEDNPIKEYVDNRIAVYNDVALGHEEISLTLKNYLEKHTNKTFVRSEFSQILSIIQPT
jgi:hypothetical protein